MVLYGGASIVRTANSWLVPTNTYVVGRLTKKHTVMRKRDTREDCIRWRYNIMDGVIRISINWMNERTNGMNECFFLSKIRQVRW
mmetsp:Transcript_16966/g.24931  ORF Transcript_16966/g.24931 Transcript_16966/m.24931 type:complete len:85 (+) Transcript_16966:87-341(+)